MPQQLRPLIILFAVLIAGLIVTRQLLVPKSFGEYGHYRGKAEEENATRDVAYAGYQACADCHEEIFEARENSRHSGVACETCHGPAAKHVDDPFESKPKIPHTRDFCPLCHGYNASRPSGFPQIIAERHNPGKPCMSCHDPHNPQLPSAPTECAACHRDIYNVKMLSHHASLDCTQCHDVPKEHLTSPELVKAKKPRERTKCGQCHAKDADSPKSIPRIDMETHGHRYKCWDCHYPHYPEASL